MFELYSIKASSNRVNEANEAGDFFSELVQAEITDKIRGSSSESSEKIIFGKSKEKDAIKNYLINQKKYLYWIIVLICSSTKLSLNDLLNCLFINLLRTIMISIINHLINHMFASAVYKTGSHGCTVYCVVFGVTQNIPELIPERTDAICSNE